MEQKEIKLTTDELTELQTIQNTYQELMLALGNNTMMLMDLEVEKNNILNKTSELKHDENKLAKKLSEKYGSGQLNPSTGVFVPATVEEK